MPVKKNWGALRYSAGDPVLAKLLLPPYWRKKSVYVKGEVLETFSEAAFGLPLLVPACRVKLWLLKSYHPSLYGKADRRDRTGVELEAAPSQEEREADLADGLEPGIDETVCASVVKACWPDSLRPYENWFEPFAFDGRKPPEAWVEYMKPEVEAALLARLG